MSPRKPGICLPMLVWKVPLFSLEGKRDGVEVH